MFTSTISAVAGAIAEARAFEEAVAKAPESERQAMRDRREAQGLEAVRRREHAEMVEAIKPHNLWSFLGLGRK